MSRRPTNMRKYRAESDRKFLIAAIVTLVVVGGGLTAVIFGWRTLFTAIPCLLGGALLILVPWFLLSGLETWRDRMERRDRPPGAHPTETPDDDTAV